MTDADDAPLLTWRMVREWEAEKADLQRVVREAQERLSEVEQKLAHASYFRPANTSIESGMGVSVSRSSAVGVPKTESMMDVVLRVVGLHHDGALPGEIRASLQASGFDMAKIDANPNYFYTVLARLVKRGRIERLPNGGYRLSSPEGETGAVGTPVPNNT